MKRICAKCKIEKDISEFYLAKKYTARYYCKTCTKELAKADRLKNIEKEYYHVKIPKTVKREYHLKKTFGISQEDFLIILESQDNKCAICQEEFTETPHIDHDHTTGKIRGLLCLKHNIGLGQFNDDIMLLERAIKYLRGER